MTNETVAPATPWLCALGWHRWRAVGNGPSIHRTLQCARCGARTVRLGAPGDQPLRGEWLAGGAWDTAPSLPPARQRSD